MNKQIHFSLTLGDLWKLIAATGSFAVSIIGILVWLSSHFYSGVLERIDTSIANQSVLFSEIAANKKDLQDQITELRGDVFRNTTPNPRG